MYTSLLQNFNICFISRDIQAHADHRTERHLELIFKVINYDLVTSQQG